MMQTMPESPHILVVDDDPDLLHLIGMLLKRIHCNSVQMKDGKSALAWLDSENQPDMVILDLMLPDVDGFELLRSIRTREQFNAVPIVILSAKADPNTIRFGLENGADEYITKPYLANSLTRRVISLLETGRKR